MDNICLVFFCAFLTTAVEAPPPELSGETPEDYTGFAENFRQLKCNIRGGKNYEWFHNDTKILPENKMFYFYQTKLLILQKPASAQYQGKYQCKAINDDGILLGPKIKVYFSMVGEFLQSDTVTEEKQVTVGRELALTCPPRTMSRNIFYHWGGRREVTGAWFLPFKKHYMIMEDGTLLFANVKEEDIQFFNVVKKGISCSIESQGRYKRLAFSQKFLLRERGDKNETPFGPTIKTDLKDREVPKGEKFIVMRCGAIGLPTPDYTWSFTGRSGRETPIISGENGYDLKDHNHILVVNSIDTKHDGWYKCKVSSTYGGKEHFDQRSARLTVKGKPQWVAGGNLSDATATEGSSFSWQCNAYGNPDPQYTWIKDGEELSHETTRGGVMKFKSITKEDEGVYQCVAENEFGEVSSSALLTVGEAPTSGRTDLCPVEKRNILFLVDGSGSVPTATFEKFKQFIRLVVEKFDIGVNTTHVAVIQYSSRDYTGLEFYFTEHQTLPQLQLAISKVKYQYGTYTFGGYAMNLADQITDHYGRADAKNAWILLMDDGVWDKALARKISRKVRGLGTKVIVLDTKNIMYDIADIGLSFDSENLGKNVDKVVDEICK